MRMGTPSLSLSDSCTLQRINLEFSTEPGSNPTELPERHPASDPTQVEHELGRAPCARNGRDSEEDKPSAPLLRKPRLLGVGQGLGALLDRCVIADLAQLAKLRSQRMGYRVPGRRRTLSSRGRWNFAASDYAMVQRRPGRAICLLQPKEGSCAIVFLFVFELQPSSC